MLFFLCDTTACYWFARILSFYPCRIPAAAEWTSP
jgi:hypothetical protein